MKQIKLLLGLILMIVSVAVMSVAAQNSSQTVTQPISVNSTSTKKANAANIVSPGDLQYIQTLQSKVQELKEVNTNLEKQVSDWKNQADNWKAVNDKYAIQNETLEKANEERRAQIEELKKADLYRQMMVADLQKENKDLTLDNAKLKSSRKFYLLTGGALGFASCSAFR